ncbi:GDSL family lysophospholipase PlaA [Legionella sp. km772]|uniref:GDSL family lysophospholipase PlaA n=1 Tax=Legionella sp. km772 TaxID=2498111 RepID=UPI000F8D4F67|nr:SGNH/GDSL hydrolase family protein [Legionella sp. km772]RUR11374.1 lysophospholipase [Legionella sp. km772]
MKLLGTLGAFLLSGIINAAPLHNVVIFGDSLSDNGNLYEFMKHQLPQSPPYYEGRFSNGPVWVEHLMASYFPNSAATHLLDYAVGGAGVSDDDEDEVLFTLKKQVNSYFLSHQDKADPNDLYIVWIGANNYLGLPEDTEQALTDVNKGIVDSIEKIIHKGAKHVLLFNIPDLGKTPAATEFDAAEMMSNFSTQHNERLYQSFNQLKQAYPEVEWLYYDLGTMFADVVKYPSHYGFTNVTDTCSIFMTDEYSKKSLLKMVSRVRPKANMDACEGYLFFDLVHPTAYAHRLIAEKVREMLDASGVEFSE